MPERKCSNPKFYCISCDEQVCHLCAHVFHDEHKVIPIYTGEMITNLDEMALRVMSRAAGGAA